MDKHSGKRVRIQPRITTDLNKFHILCYPGLDLVTLTAVKYLYFIDRKTEEHISRANISTHISSWHRTFKRLFLDVLKMSWKRLKMSIPMDSLWAPHGRPMSAPCTPIGTHMDSRWTPHGPSMGSQGSWDRLGRSQCEFGLHLYSQICVFRIHIYENERLA